MIFVERLIRRAARVIGWEIGSAIGNIIWSIAIGIGLLCCCAIGAVVVAWQIMFQK